MVYNASTDRFAMGVWGLMGPIHTSKSSIQLLCVIAHTTSLGCSRIVRLCRFVGQCEAVKMNRTVNYSGFVDLILNPKPSESPSPGVDSTSKVPDELHRKHDGPAEADDRSNTPG